MGAGLTIFGDNMDLFYGTLFLISYIQLWHFIADFGFQTRYVGENKGKNNTILLFHICVYMCVMSVGLYIGMLFFQLSILGIIKYVCLNGLLHGCTDYVTSRLNGYFYSKKQMNKFWLTIGADQLIHNVCLTLTSGILF